ncbi:MAG TPA: 2,3-bisphosphoglycerate-independent phosphoglycerate mutase, partial [Bacillota bacterium]
TGVLAAAVRACEAVDRGLSRVIEALLARGGAALVCADHGNAEVMVDPDTGQPHTAHTTNPVPVILVSPAHRGRRLRDGVLADVAPTLCELLGIEPAPEMDRPSLLL